MKSRTVALLVGTHLLALGAGWRVVTGRDMESSNASPQSRLASKTDRPMRQERRVATADLLAAYGDSEFWGEAMVLRSKATRPAPPAGGETPYVKPELRAAEVADIAAAIGKELEAVNGGKTYDYELVRALVARWMTEDPAACAAWLGRMEMRGGWGDPFDAFAKSLPPLELLALIDDGWLQRNRSQALSYLARQVGSASAADLPAILSRFGEGESIGFLLKAADQARAEDAAVWLSLADDYPQLVRELAAQWIEGPGASWEWRDGQLAPSRREMDEWENAARLALAAAAGTPAEEAFRQRWEEQRQASEAGRELVRVAREPVEASAALVDLFVAGGHDEAEARRLATEKIEGNYRNGLETWQRQEWELGLQLSLLGDRRLEEVLDERLAAIDSSLPEVLRSGTRNQSLREAMELDAALTLQVARQRGLQEDAIRGATELVGDSDTSLALQAEVLLALAEQGLWVQGGRLPALGTFTAEYLRDDPVAARVWLARLPASLPTPTGEGGR